jgi:DNA-binding beta-propeller fold protein YncE
LLLAGLLVLGGGMPAAAGEHYDVYSYDRWDEAVPSQAGYLAERAVSGRDLGIGDLNEPADLFLDSKDRLYIADSKNDRIIVTDASLSTVLQTADTFTMPDGSKTTLSVPTGIYVSPETGDWYIADHDHSRVLVADENGMVRMEITKPDSELYAAEMTFLPQRVLADKAGNVYVVLGNITTGAAMFNADGEFVGYYGANTVEATSKVVADYFWKLISTEEMRSRQSRTVPTGITSFDLDDEGFIYTCTQSVSQRKDMVKKLNPAGDNLFAQENLDWGDFQSVYDANTNTSYQSMLCDIDVAADGSINCLDLTAGRVFQYDKDGNLLFISGTKGDQLGGFTEAAAIESCGDTILVLDKRKGTVTVFRETDFGAAVHHATTLYNGGYYEEAIGPWQDVLRYDGNYRRAFLGLSAGYLVQGDYKASMEYAKLADSSYRYDRAFECWRQEWLTQHGKLLIVLVLAAVLAGMLLPPLYRRSRRDRHKESRKERAV